jgi:hypothetical protein
MSKEDDAAWLERRYQERVAETRRAEQKELKAERDLEHYREHGRMTREARGEQRRKQ